jgi:hypothetical protein
MTAIEQLRANYATVRAWMVACGEWSVEDAVDIGACIADAAQAAQQGVYGELAFWCDWMSHWADIATAHKQQMDALDRAAALWWLETGRKVA